MDPSVESPFPPPPPPPFLTFNTAKSTNLILSSDCWYLRPLIHETLLLLSVNRYSFSLKCLCVVNLELHL